MKTKRALRFLTIAATLATAWTLGGGTAQAATCTVPSVVPFYPTIQSAVNDPSCNPINVLPGAYPESVTINRPLTLNGAQAGNSPFAGRTFGGPFESTIIGVTTATITIQAPNVTINGFSVTNPGRELAIRVRTAGDDAVITNNIVDTVGSSTFGDNTVGIYLELGPDRVRVVRNWISNVQSGARTAQGVLVGDSTSANPSLNILLAVNLIEDITSASRGAYGIQVNNGASSAPAATGFTTVLILGNTIRGLTGNWAHAIGLEGDTPGVVVRGNSISLLVDTNPIPIADAVAVFFEANPSFPTARVNRNNFDVTPLAFGIALHPALLATPDQEVDGTCNWWGHEDGPGPVGPNPLGAKVTPNVDFTPWLTAPAPGGQCVGGAEDGDEGEEDGEDAEDDEDGEDGDQDGVRDDEDEDDDNDGQSDAVDSDDDEDGINDGFDSKFTKESQKAEVFTLGSGQEAQYVLTANSATLFVTLVLRDSQALAMDILDPLGAVIAGTPPMLGRAILAVPTVGPGNYTVRLRNIGVSDVTSKLLLIRSDRR